jgi:hypothetical protein
MTAIYILIVVICIVWFGQPHITSLDYTAFGVGLVTALLLSRLFFSNWNDFWEGFWDSGRRWILRTEENEDARWSGIMFAIWSFLALGCGLLAYYKLPVWLPHFFK